MEKEQWQVPKIENNRTCCSLVSKLCKAVALPKQQWQKEQWQVPNLENNGTCCSLVSKAVQGCATA
jgi:hypothetical protein